MAIYVFLLVFIIVLGIIMFYKKNNLEISEKKVSRKLYLIISFSVLCVVMAFRGLSVGTDTKLYVSIFNNYSNMSWIDVLTFKDAFIGFAIFNKIVSVISADSHAILVAAAVLTCFLTARFIYKNSDHVVYSTALFILFYHYLNCFNIFRQYIAIMIVVNALPLLIKKKTLKYALICILAMSIHNTAVMALLLLPLSKMEFDKKSVAIYTVIMFFTIFLAPLAMNKFAELFPHYQMYFENQYMNYSGYGLIILIMIYCFISFMAIISRNKTYKDEEKRKFMLLLMINNLAIIANIMSYKYFILYRVSLYYSIYLIIFIPMVFDRFNKNLLIYVMFFIIMLVPFTSKLISNDGQIIPYHTDIVMFNR